MPNGICFTDRTQDLLVTSVVPTRGVEPRHPGLQPVCIPNAGRHVGDERRYRPLVTSSPRGAASRDAVCATPIDHQSLTGRGEDRKVEQRGIEPPTRRCKRRVFPLNDCPVRPTAYSQRVAAWPGYTVGIEPTFSGSQPLALPLGYVHHVILFSRCGWRNSRSHFTQPTFRPVPPGAAGGNRTPASCLQNSGTATMRQRQNRSPVVHDRHPCL